MRRSNIYRLDDWRWRTALFAVDVALLGGLATAVLLSVAILAPGWVRAVGEGALWLAGVTAGVTCGMLLFVLAMLALGAILRWLASGGDEAGEGDG